MKRIAMVLCVGLAGGAAGAAELVVEAGADLTAVRDRVRASTGEARVTRVVLSEGAYRVDGTGLEFGVEDSGVTWVAEAGQEVVISGGREISGWRDEGGVWVAEVEAGSDFRELFVGGARRVRARFPNVEFLRVAEVGDDKRTWFRFGEGDLNGWSEELVGSELVFFHDWSTSRVEVGAIEPEGRVLRTRSWVGNSARHYAMDWFEKQPRYYLEDARVFLDAPGEWFLDGQAGRVYYVPVDGEELDGFVAEVPVAGRVLGVRGNEGERVKGLNFEGVTFRHCANGIQVGGYAGMQASFYEMRPSLEERSGRKEGNPAAVLLDWVEGCGFERCVFEGLGGSGLWVRDGCRDVVVEDCVVTDVSGNGIMVGEQNPGEAAVTKGVRIEKCLVEKCGAQFFGSVGVWVGIAEGVEILRNEVRELPYTGISVGWRWSDAPSACKGHLVEGNHIHDVMQVLSDGGGIYTLGRQPGTVLRGNRIHGVPLNLGRAESNGMFLDEGTTELLIEGNEVWDVEKSPFRFHRAGKNVLRNNEATLGEGVPLVRFNNTPEENVVVEGNVLRR